MYAPWLRLKHFVSEFPVEKQLRPLIRRDPAAVANAMKSIQNTNAVDAIDAVIYHRDVC